MASWGDINVALNRLVDAGTITSFRTNHANRTDHLGLHVVAITPAADRQSPDFDPQRIEMVRQQVAEAVAGLTADATVTVTGRLP